MQCFSIFSSHSGQQCAGGRVDPVGGMRAGTPSTLKLWRLTDETVLFPAAMLLILAVLLAGQDALAATGMGIKLPEDPTKAYITLGILVAAAVMFSPKSYPCPSPPCWCRWRFP